MRYEELTIEGRNAVLEAFRSGKTIDKLFVLDGCQDGPVRTILREAKKHDTIVQFVKKERLDQLSQTGHHQGVIASAAAYEYAEISDILQNAKDKGEAPFIIFLDNIEDPHNLGAIIRTANLAGAHGCIEMLFLISQFTHGKGTGGIGSSFQIMSTSIHQKKALRLNRYIAHLGSRIVDNGSMTSISTDRRKALLHIVFLLCPSCFQIICH